MNLSGRTQIKISESVSIQINIEWGSKSEYRKSGVVCPAMNIIKNKPMIAASLLAFILFLAVIRFCLFFTFPF